MGQSDSGVGEQWSNLKTLALVFRNIMTTQETSRIQVDMIKTRRAISPCLASFTVGKSNSAEHERVVPKRLNDALNGCSCPDVF